MVLANSVVDKLPSMSSNIFSEDQDGLNRELIEPSFPLFPTVAQRGLFFLLIRSSTMSA